MPHLTPSCPLQGLMLSHNRFPQLPASVGRYTCFLYRHADLADQIALKMSCRLHHDHLRILAGRQSQLVMDYRPSHWPLVKRLCFAMRYRGLPSGRGLLCPCNPLLSAHNNSSQIHLKMKCCPQRPYLHSNIELQQTSSLHLEQRPRDCVWPTDLGACLAKGGSCCALTTLCCLLISKGFCQKPRDLAHCLLHSSP